MTMLLQSRFSVVSRRNVSDGEFIETGEEGRSDIFDYIEVFYNRTRRHSYLGQVSPYEFEKAAACGSL